ncbi:MAG: hypothetical protein HUK40_02085 [Desulfobacter sp.]|nr:hypothetical protein [Desulfobacter sp.]
MKIKTNFYTFTPYDTLLYVESFLSWDGRVALDFATDAKQIILEHYQNKPWAILHDARAWQLGTPEVEKMIGKLLNTPRKNHLTHHAYVTGASEIQKWQAEKVFKDIRAYEARIFDSLDHAKTWLLSFGYADH